MKINPIQFNFVQSKPQSTSNTHFRLNNQLQCDTVSFTSNTRTEKMNKLVPRHKGIIYKKITDKDGYVIRKIPVEVDIIKAGPEKFRFMHKGDEVGYVQVSYIPRKECINEIEDYDSNEPLYKNYKDYGMVGARLGVDYVKNCNQEKYGGIGHLADLLEVACCKELGIKPKIISFSCISAAPFHYMRGKRFLPYGLYCSEKQMKKKDLYGKDFNETVKEIIEETPLWTEDDVPEFKDDDFLPLMYVPKDMVRKLQKELKEHPIF